LNCGRWDYIFSFIKKFNSFSNCVLPDRDKVTMEVPFMRAYVDLLIKTCHRRHVHAMGGMAAQIPVRDDPAKNEAALESVRRDKLREARLGHDGTWVAHPGLIPVAQKAFDEHMSPQEKNQIKKKPRDDVRVTEADLIAIPKQEISDAGVRGNIRVCVLYLEPWLRGTGCVPIDNKMEDAATAEICRCQIWQWIKHNAKTIEGNVIDRKFVQNLVKDVEAQLKREFANVSGNKLDEAFRLTEKLIFSEELIEFLTLIAYPRVTTIVEDDKVSKL